MKHILVVEDDLELLASLMRSFRPHGDEWDISVARSGTDAVRQIRKQRFDLVITDMLMPDCDGIEVTMTVRREQPDIGVIAMSGGGRLVGTEPLRAAALLGAYATLEKPFEFSQLVAAIHRWLDTVSSTTPARGRTP